MKADGLGVDELIARLRASPKVVALLRHGSRSRSDGDGHGDVDLVAIVDGRPAGLESVHLYARAVPVDLSFRTLGELKGVPEPDLIELALIEADTVFDRTGGTVEEIARRRPAPRALGEEAIAFHRFTKTHAPNRVEGRLESRPLMVEMVLMEEVY